MKYSKMSNILLYFKKTEGSSIMSKQIHPDRRRRFLVINKWTLIALFLVITAGGVVRSTGSGMGCPDWPRCFDRIIPPTDASQLPEGYEEKYIAGRQAKNERFANFIEKFGYDSLAYQLRHDESILVHEEFNAAKTWTEYGNRLVGVVTGFMLILSAYYAYAFFHIRKSIFVWSILNVILVGIQGWFGSIVVSTNLVPWTITLHMLLALVIVCISVYTYYAASQERVASSRAYKAPFYLKALALISMFLLVVQVITGTEVRELVDVLDTMQPVLPRGEWIEAMGSTFENHRWLSYLSTLLILCLFWFIRNKYSKDILLNKYAISLFALIALQFLSGIVLARWALPPAFQTIHLVLSSLLVANQFYVVLLLTKSSRS
jgi:cytochrome c oxidase assembly protein subunit 15